MNVQAHASGAAIPRIVVAGIVVGALGVAAIGYALLASRKHGELGRYLYEMQSSLRNIESSQETHFAEHERYASDACADGARCALLGLNAPAQVELRATGTANGWSAVAAHAELPDDSCSIHVAGAASPGVSAAPGEVSCTAFWP